MGIWLVCGAWIHEGTHWRHHVPWTWVPNHHVKETKINTQSRRFSGRITLYQGSTIRDTLLRCRFSLLVSTSCIRTNWRKMGVSWSPMAQNTFKCIIFLSRVIFWLGTKLWNISQWEICLEINSLNLDRALFSGNSAQRYKVSLMIQGSWIYDGENLVNHNPHITIICLTSCQIHRQDAVKKREERVGYDPVQ